MVRGDRFSLEEQTGIHRQRISNLILGTKMSLFGWYNPEKNPEGLTASELISRAISSPVVHNLHHYDGRQWSGTRREFASTFGAELTFQSEEGHCCGWYRSAEDAARHEARLSDKGRKVASARGDISGASNPNADRTPVRLVGPDGVVETRLRTEWVFETVLEKADIQALVDGAQVSAKGFRLFENRDAVSGEELRLQRMREARRAGRRRDLYEHASGYRFWGCLECAAKVSGVPPDNLGDLRRHKGARASVHGWRIVGVPAIPKDLGGRLCFPVTPGPPPAPPIKLIDRHDHSSVIQGACSAPPAMKFEIVDPEGRIGSRTADEWVATTPLTKIDISNLIMGRQASARGG